MYANLENKTREYPKIQFIDRALREGEKTHYRCFDCGQYILQDLRYTHKCKVIPKMIPLPLDVKARKMKLNLIRELYGEKYGRNSN